MQTAILAGGLATRLGSLTAETPKSLIAIDGEPFIDHQLRLLAKNGVDKVVLCIGHLGESIRRHVGTGAAFGLRVEYSVEGERLLGTGGALKLAAPMLDDAFFVTWGDSYLLLDYQDVWNRFTSGPYAGLMVVFHNRNEGDRSNVILAGNRVAKYDKWAPDASYEYIDHGLTALKKETLERIPAGEAFALEEIFRDLADEGELGAYVTTQRFYEIGSKDGIAELEAYMKQGALK